MRSSPRSRGWKHPPPDRMTDTLVLSWEALDGLVARLAEQTGRDFDLVLAIARGGLVPAGMLAYRLNLREILVVGAEFYRAEGGTHDRPRIGQLPADELLAGRRVLVVDEVWETGETMTEVLARLRAPAAEPGERRPALQADPLPRARARRTITPRSSTAGSRTRTRRAPEPVSQQALIL